MFSPDCLFVCLSVCWQDNSKSCRRIFLKFWEYVGHGTTYPRFNFGYDPKGILDSGSLWIFCYHCFQWGIRETAAKPKMVLPPSEQHCLGGGLRALTVSDCLCCKKSTQTSNKSYSNVCRKITLWFSFCCRPVFTCVIITYPRRTQITTAITTASARQMTANAPTTIPTIMPTKCKEKTFKNVYFCH